MANNNSQNFDQRLIPTYLRGNINNKFSCTILPRETHKE